jgi:hypothetical protein
MTRADPYQGGVVTTQPPIPSASPASPATPSKDPASITAPLREWGALLLVVATAALLFLTLIELLVINTAVPFGDRASAYFLQFVGPEVVVFPVLAVILATHVKPVVPKAKVITLLALIDYGFAALMGLITLFAGFVQAVSGSATDAFVTLLVGLVWLALLGFAGFVVLRVYMGAYTAPKPAPGPGGYPGYPGYSGYPPQPGYGQQQPAGQAYPQGGYQQQPAYGTQQQPGYPTQPGYQQAGYPTQAYQAPAAPAAQPSSAPPSGPYPSYSVSPPSSTPPADSSTSGPPAYQSGQSPWGSPGGDQPRPSSAPSSGSPYGGSDTPVPTDTGLGDGGDRTQALPPRSSGAHGQHNQPGEEPTQRWG